MTDADSLTKPSKPKHLLYQLCLLQSGDPETKAYSIGLHCRYFSMGFADHSGRWQRRDPRSRPGPTCNLSKVGRDGCAADVIHSEENGAKRVSLSKMSYTLHAAILMTTETGCISASIQSPTQYSIVRLPAARLHGRNHIVSKLDVVIEQIGRGRRVVDQTSRKIYLEIIDTSILDRRADRDSAGTHVSSFPMRRAVKLTHSSHSLPSSPTATATQQYRTTRSCAK